MKSSVVVNISAGEVYVNASVDGVVSCSVDWEYNSTEWSISNVEGAAVIDDKDVVKDVISVCEEEVDVCSFRDVVVFCSGVIRISDSEVYVNASVDVDPSCSVLVVFKSTWFVDVRSVDEKYVSAVEFFDIKDVVDAAAADDDDIDGVENVDFSIWVKENDVCSFWDDVVVWKGSDVADISGIEVYVNAFVDVNVAVDIGVVEDVYILVCEEGVNASVGVDISCSGLTALKWTSFVVTRSVDEE